MFEIFTSSLIGLPIKHVWEGYGSAIFLEFGTLHAKERRDGKPGNPQGDWTLMIEWSWRIEGKRRIWCGSWSDEARRSHILARLKNARVLSVSLIGRLSEVSLKLDNGLHIVSFMTAESDPAWALIRRHGDTFKSVKVSAGRLVFEDKYP